MKKGDKRMPYHDKKIEMKDRYLFEYRKIFATPHFHVVPELLFLREGELTTTINGETRLMKAGDACFCSGFTIHSYIPTETANLGYVIGIPTQTADSLFFLFKKKTPPVFFRFEDYELLDFLLRICNAPHEKTYLKQAVFDSAMQLLYVAIADKNEFVERQKDSHDSLISDILNYAQENYEKPLTLDVLSKQFGYARETLSRLLHRFLGESWNSYVNRMRVYKAQQLMQQSPRQSISEIIYKCGFNSPNTFYRAYMREFGVTPRITTTIPLNIT